MMYLKSKLQLSMAVVVLTNLNVISQNSLTAVNNELFGLSSSQNTEKNVSLITSIEQQYFDNFLQESEGMTAIKYSGEIL